MLTSSLCAAPNGGEVHMGVALYWISLGIMLFAFAIILAVKMMGRDPGNSDNEER